MKFTCQVEIKKPLDKVVKSFHNPENLKHWQEGFIRHENLEGKPGEVGAKAMMVYNIKGKELELTETILVNDFPNHFVGKYDCGPMTNTMSSRFDSIDEHSTVYTAEVEYVRFNGIIVKLMATFYPSMMKKQTQKWLDNFKNWMESQD